MKHKHTKEDFKAYPTRPIRLPNELWEQFKTAKLKSGLTWSNFIKQLLEK